MKVGIHLSSYTTDWNDCGFDFIPVAAEAGYEAVELPLMFPETYDYRKAGALLRENGLFCTCGTGVNPMEDPSSPDEKLRRKGVERLKKCIDIVSELGADSLGGVLYSPWGLKKPRSQAAENYKWARDSIAEAAEYAGKSGITLSLEVLNRYESYFMNTVEEGLAFAQSTGCENVKLHFDTFHAHIEERNLKEAILLGGKNIHHVHLCDNNRRAPGTGSINFHEVKEALEMIGYDRYLMVENFILPDTDPGNEGCIWREPGCTVYENAAAACKYAKALFLGR